MTPHGNGLEDASMFCGRTDMGYSASADSRHLQAAKDTVLGACYALGGDMMATASDTGAIQVRLLLVTPLLRGRSCTCKAAQVVSSSAGDRLAS
jgi:hypothetical protein